MYLRRRFCGEKVVMIDMFLHPSLINSCFINILIDHTDQAAIHAECFISLIFTYQNYHLNLKEFQKQQIDAIIACFFIIFQIARSCHSSVTDSKQFARVDYHWS